MKEEKIGEQPDQLVKNIRDDPGNQPNRRRQKRNQHNPKLRRGFRRQWRYSRSRHRRTIRNVLFPRGFFLSHESCLSSVDAAVAPLPISIPSTNSLSTIRGNRSPEGATFVSPARKRWVSPQRRTSPVGTARPPSPLLRDPLAPSRVRHHPTQRRHQIRSRASQFLMMMQRQLPSTFSPLGVSASSTSRRSSCARSRRTYPPRSSRLINSTAL